ncbi:unnamed protein product [Oikopleura dioica]|uniref:Hypoxia up-regulated protein 1 n=1 Tax=Oikopleura dioica TaxID=34765 RepID=E4XER0_OIKDI|nr:unnamed protein product [Oikopleura dioica]
MRLFILAVALLGYAAALGVMSVDLGSEWFKVAIVKPGVPMEIALNKESKRKTPVAVFMRNGERLFGSDAVTSGNRYPHNSYRYFPLILGKSIDDPAVKDFQQKFPYYELVPTERNTVAFKHPEGDVIYTVESLLAMVLGHAREIASKFAEGPIYDAVITVPSQWGQVERKSVIAAAEIAGIKLHQLMNTNTAVALHYGVFNRKQIESKAKNILFFDMGASQTTATIAQYQIIKGKTETAPQVAIKGVGVAPVGGLKMDLTVRDKLVEKWEETKKTASDIKTQKTGRAMAKLLVAANKAKIVLSANKEHMAGVQQLIDDEDFKAKITRDELEASIQGDIEQAMEAVREAFKSSGMTNDEISQIIMFGGGMRVPAIQDALRKELNGAELSFNINADEAAALGGSYHAAFVSKVFRVKTMFIKDAVQKPVEVRFERDLEPEEVQEDGTTKKTIKRTLFQKMNPYPQKKAITFNRFSDDFSFSVFIDGQLQETVNLAGVKGAHENNTHADPKGVKAHFRMNDSGILVLESADATFEHEVFEEPEEPKEEKKAKMPDIPDIDLSTLDKLKDKFGSFFNGEDTDGKTAEQVLEELSKAAKEKKDGEEMPAEEQAEAEPSTEEAQGEPVAEEKTTTEEEKPVEEEPKTEEAKEGEEEPAESAEPAEEAKPEEPKKVVKKFSVNLESSAENHGLEFVSGSERESINEQIKALDQADADRLAKEKSFNDLESFIYDRQDKLYREGWTDAISEEKREEVAAALTAASDWLWDVEEPTSVTFDDKLAELKTLTRDWERRYDEHEKRPEAVERLEKMITGMRELFLETYKNQTGEGLALSQENVFELSEKLDKVADWLKEKTDGQAALAAHEDPALKVMDIQVKEKTLANAGEVLYKKIRMWRPPKPTEPPTIEPTTTGEESEEVNAEDGEEVKPASDDKPAEEPTTEKPAEDTTHDGSEL